MGLEEFTSDDNSVDESSSSSNSSSKVEKLTKENQPTMINQSFGPESEVEPRDIKYQIKSLNLNWISQFSKRRCDDGEVVMYSHLESHKAEVIAIFTGIRSFDSEPPYDNNLDIDITIFDKKNREVLQSKTVEYQDNWKEYLWESIDDMYTLYKREYSEQANINSFPERE